ncbi:hypothetical protein DID80_05315 [Candidatus Marinamargulisbacteria bacterium SCGC AAA071-K20]|nr:hypothetical protein DID80_05315 [Candidatus Marinamargulisbacteria bacterium SCGC AAA071-K20]
MKLTKLLLIVLVCCSNSILCNVDYFLNPNPVVKGQMMYLAVKDAPSYSQMWLKGNDGVEIVEMLKEGDGVWYAVIPVNRKTALEGHFLIEVTIMLKDGDVNSLSIPYQVLNKPISLLETNRLDILNDLIADLSVKLTTVQRLYDVLIRKENKLIKLELKSIKSQINPDLKKSDARLFMQFSENQLSNIQQKKIDYETLYSLQIKQKKLLSLRNKQLYKEGLKIKINDDEFKTLREKQRRLSSLTRLYYRELNYIDMTIRSYSDFKVQLENEIQWLKSDLNSVETQLSKYEKSTFFGSRFSHLNKRAIEENIDVHMANSQRVDVYIKLNNDVLKLYKKQLKVSVDVLNLRNFRDDLKL